MKKHRYVYSKYIKSTGHVIEGRGWTKAVAKTRFTTAKKAFHRLKDSGLFEVDQFGKTGKVLIRKSLISNYLRTHE